MNLENSTIIDFHSHILPGIDDGSPDIQTSLNMLRIIADQGVRIQVLTPHFYAWQNDIPAFLSRRNSSFDELRRALPPGAPELLCGAEVAYFPNMSSAPKLKKLCIGDSNTMLLEMPFESWTSDVIDDLTTLALDRGYQLVLAHVERYLPYKRNPEKLTTLSRLPIFFQVNAESFLHFTTRRRVLHLATAKRSLILGSDTHNLTTRPPNLADGRRVVVNKLGTDYLRRMDEAAQLLLQGEKKIT